MAEKSDDSAERRGLRFNMDVNVYSIGATALAFLVAGVWMQADVRALQTKDIAIETKITETSAQTRAEIQRVENHFTRRMDAGEQRAERDREAILTMQGDIRVIRHILEGVARPSPR
jgi:hypothetical protein